MLRSALLDVWPLAALSAWLEPGAVHQAIDAGWQFWVAVAYSALVVSVVAHTIFYSLIQRYEANLISPLTLMTPLATIGLGIMITHDHFDARMAVGAALALLGVLIIAIRGNTVLPRIAAIWSRSA